MTATPLPHEWSKESLFNKAQRYADVMLEQNRDSWQFGFWSALTLEMLGRAALAAVSPTLLADSKDWNNIYFALGHSPNERRFTPKSADIAEVFRRLERINPSFTSEMLNFCITHMQRRNSELHSGGLPFDNLGTSEWLGMFYAVSRVLLQSLEEDLGLLLGASEAEAAETLIQALEDRAAKAVERTINAHREVWNRRKALNGSNFVSRPVRSHRAISDIALRVLRVEAPDSCMVAPSGSQSNRSRKA